MTEPPRVLLLYGCSAAGKSTLANLVSTGLPRCAHIEIDVLRYMIRGGLVAHCGGTPPRKAPLEAARQVQLGMDNAVRLATGFLNRGFSCVLEGLNESTFPGSGWAEFQFPEWEVINILVEVDQSVLIDRWKDRSWGTRLPTKLLDIIGSLNALRGQFDLVVNTTKGEPADHAQRILKRLN